MSIIFNEEAEAVGSDSEEEVAETGDEAGDEAAEGAKAEKPKRTPEEELAYYEGRAKRLRKDLGLNEDTKPEKPSKKGDQKSDGLDYGAKAFLTANGIKGAKEFEFVQSELKKSGEELESLLENDYFQTRLKTFRDLNNTSDATPTGKRSGGVPTESVDYWLGKPFEEVPQEMRAKVVQAKLDKESNKSPFYNS